MNILKQKSNEVLNIDRVISGMMKKRRFIIKEINNIIRTDSAQLNFPFYELGNHSRIEEFPRRKSVS